MFVLALDKLCILIDIYLILICTFCFLGFLLYCGLVFLVSTTLVGLLKRETPPRPEEEPSPNILGTYKLLLKIIRLPTVKTIVFIMLTCRVRRLLVDNGIMLQHPD